MTAVSSIGDDPAERTSLRRALRLHESVFDAPPDAATLARYAARRRGGETLAGLAASLLATAGLDPATVAARYRARWAPSAPADAPLDRLIEDDPAVGRLRLLPILFPDGTSPGHGAHYRWWLEENQALDDADRARIRALIADLPRRPRLSFVVIAHDGDATALADTLRALAAQLYGEIEVLVVAAGRVPAVSAGARVVAAPGARTPAALFNAGLAACSGDFVAVVEAGDALFETASFEAAAAIAASPSLRILFSDEDAIHPDGRRHAPVLKSWRCSTPRWRASSAACGPTPAPGPSTT